MSKRCKLQKEYYQAKGNYKGNGKYCDKYVSWLEDKILALRIHDVSGSLQEHKQVIKDLMETYIINLDENGSPKASITDIMKLIDRAVKLIGNDR